MRAWIVESLDGIDALTLRAEDAAPAPGPGEVTLAMTAMGLNFPDLLMLSGRYQLRPPLPFTPGMEGVGRVVAVGEGVVADLLGQRLLVGARYGLLAESVTVPLDALRSAPEAFSDAEAAGFTVGALTAQVALVERGRLQPGEHLLVLGAGGGMGLAAVALAATIGARVTAVASSAAKRAAALAAGATDVIGIDRDAPDFSRLRGEVDVVFDPVGGAVVVPALKTLRWGGRYLLVGFAAGIPMPLPTNLPLLKGIELLGVRAGESGRRDPDAGRRSRAAIDALANEGRLRPLIGLETPFAEAPAAFRAMEAGTLSGKAVIHIGDGSAR